MLSDIELTVIIVLLSLMSASPIIALKRRSDDRKNSQFESTVFDKQDETNNGIKTLTYSALGANSSASITKSRVTTSQKIANIIPIIVLLITALYVFIGPDFLKDTKLEGKWYYYMETGNVGGVENLTEYWYMDISEDGSLDIGWKNLGNTEESQGWGNWYQSGDIVNLTIHYDYGDSVTWQMYISSGKLFDATSDSYTGWEKE